jgi:hypothetical protein
MTKLFKLTLYVIFALIIMSSLFAVFQKRFSWTPIGADTQTVFADYEYQTLDFLNNYSALQGARIVSDPITIRFFTSLGNREWIIEHSMNPNFFTQEGQAVVADIRNNILLAPDSKTAYNHLMNLTSIVPYDEKGYLDSKDDVPNPGLIVICSGRTAYWLDNSEGISTPSVLFPFSYNVTTKHVFQFLDPTYFKLVYKIDQRIYVFKVKPEPSYSVKSYFETTFLDMDLMKVGRGGYDADLTPLQNNADTSTLHSNNQTMFVNVKNGAYEKWVLIHNFPDLTDFSGFDLLAARFQGQNTNATFRISIDGPTTSDRTIFLFKDTSTVYQTVLFDLKMPYAREQHPDLHSTTRILLTPHLGKDVYTGKWYVSIAFIKLESQPNFSKNG